MHAARDVIIPRSRQLAHDPMPTRTCLLAATGRIGESRPRFLFLLLLCTERHRVDARDPMMLRR